MHNPLNSINKAFEHDVKPLIGKLSDLRDKRIGVDGNKIIMNVNESTQLNEPFAMLSTSVPFATYNAANALDTLVRECGLKLEVVFNGVPIIKRIPADLQKSKPRALLQVSGRPDDAISRMLDDRKQQLKAEISSVLNEDGEDYLFSYIKLYDKESMQTTRAPYWAWAQLASYFTSQNNTTPYLDEVYGCLELLAFRGVKRVITEITPETNTYKYYTQEQLVEYLTKHASVSTKLTADDLPALFAMCSNHKLFNETLTSDFQRFKSFHRCDCGKLMDPNPGAKSTRFLARVVEFCPVMTFKGECVPLSTLHGIGAPNCDFLFGERLDPIFYYAVMAGLLNPSALGPVATLQVVDSQPTVDSTEYRQVSEMIIPLRAQILHQLFLKKNPTAEHAHENINMMWIRRYNIGQGRQVPLNYPPPITLDEWDTRSAASQDGNLYFTTVSRLSDKACKEAEYNTTDSALAAILLKSMDLMGYFTHSASNQQDNPDVSGPSIYSKAMEECTTVTLSEYAVLLIELFRTKLLTANPLSIGQSPSGRPPMVDVPLFASRLLSIIPLRLNSQWSGPVSADLAGFTAMARMLQRSLRSLTEVIATTTLIHTRRGQKPPVVSAHDFVSKIQPKLPFSIPLTSCAGLVIQVLMTKAMTRQPCTLAELNALFPDCVNLEEDLSTIFGFWWFAGHIILKMRDEEDDLGEIQAIFARAHSILVPAATTLNPTMFGYLHQLRF